MKEEQRMTKFKGHSMCKGVRVQRIWGMLRADGDL